MLLHAGDHRSLLSCERILEQSYPGFTHKLGIVEGMPPLERYLRCSEFLTEIAKADDGNITLRAPLPILGEYGE